MASPGVQVRFTKYFQFSCSSLWKRRLYGRLYSQEPIVWTRYAKLKVRAGCIHLTWHLYKGLKAFKIKYIPITVIADAGYRLVEERELGATPVYAVGGDTSEPVRVARRVGIYRQTDAPKVCFGIDDIVPMEDEEKEARTPAKPSKQAAETHIKSEKKEKKDKDKKKKKRKEDEGEPDTEHKKKKSKKK